MCKSTNKNCEKTRNPLILQSTVCSYQQIFLLCVDMSHIVVSCSHEMNWVCENNYISAGKIKPLGRRSFYEKDFCGVEYGCVLGGV